nr:unnamed protein product [Callosobruchus analis]
MPISVCKVEKRK